MDLFFSIINSNGLQTLAAIIVGAFIFIQYRVNKRDQVKDAAALIVIELQGAERTVKNIKKRLADKVLDSDISVMPSNSWQDYRQLFSKQLERDEWDTIEEYYNRASLLDDTIKYNNQMFRNDVEQIRINKQRAAADFAIDTVNNIGSDTNKEDVAELFSNKVKVYDTLYMSKQGELSYAPNRNIDDAKKYIENLPDILNSSALEKLKNISKKGKL
jgi:hypothetical protein